MIEQGVSTARVKPLIEEKTGSAYFGVICYVLDSAGDAAAEREVLDQLRRLADSAAPAFEPRFATVVAGLENARDVTYQSKKT